MWRRSGLTGFVGNTAALRAACACAAVVSNTAALRASLLVRLCAKNGCVRQSYTASNIKILHVARTHVCK